MAKTPFHHLPIAVRVKEGARLIGVSRSHFYKLLRAEKIPSHKDGAARMILTEDLFAYVKELPTGPPLSVVDQQIAIERAGKPEEPPPPPPRPDFRAIHDARVKLLARDVEEAEASARAFEYTVSASMRYYRVGLEEAKLAVLKAISP